MDEVIRDILGFGHGIHVHVHNVKIGEMYLQWRGTPMKFMGYKGPDGRVGIRNHVLVMATCVCATDTARIVSSNVNGTVTFHNQNGCGQIGRDFEMTLDVEAGYAANPNVYGTLIGLGCEEHQVRLVALGNPGENG